MELAYQTHPEALSSVSFPTQKFHCHNLNFQAAEIVERHHNYRQLSVVEQFRHWMEEMMGQRRQHSRPCLTLSLLLCRKSSSSSLCPPIEAYLPIEACGLAETSKPWFVAWLDVNASLSI
jgi:hypothetical protein